MLAAFFALYGLYEGPFRPFSEARGMNIESSTKGKKDRAWDDYHLLKQTTQEVYVVKLKN